MERKTFGKSNSGDVRRARHTDIGRKSGNAQRKAQEDRQAKREQRRSRNQDDD